MRPAAISSVLILGHAIACSTSNSSKPAPDTVVVSSTVGEQAPAEDSTIVDYLAHHAKLLTDDTLFLYSAEHDSTWPFAGRSMDIMFSDSIGYAYPQFRSGSPPVILVGAIHLDEGIAGYVVRVPGFYDSFTRLGLVVYDSVRREFGHGLDLADEVGDAGSFSVLYAWIIRPEGGKLVQLYQRMSHSEMDLETTKHIFASDSLAVRPWTGRTFGPPQLIRDTNFRRLFDVRRWLARQRAPA